MDRKTTMAILLVTAMLFSLSVNSSASIKECFKKCYQECREQGDSKGFCKYRCAMECISIPLPSESNPKGSFSCANLSCGHLDPEGEDMVACLDNYSAKCSKLQKYP